jgi:hypothetical protein
MKGGERRDESGLRNLPVDAAPYFFEVAGFIAEWTGLGLTDADLHALQMTLADRPTAGAVVAGTNGVRKIRVSAIGSGRGKSGSFRVFYLPVIDHDVIVFIATLSKSERENLDKAGRNAVAKMAATLKASLEKGRKP